MLYSHCCANKCLIHTHIPLAIYVYIYTHRCIYMHTLIFVYIYVLLGLPRWFSGKESTCQAGNSGSVPGLGSSLGEGTGNALQCSCMEIPWTEGSGGLQYKES